MRSIVAAVAGWWFSPNGTVSDMNHTCKNARLDNEENELDDDGVCCH